MPDADRSRPAHLQLLAVSWNFGWPIAAGVIFGHWLDESIGTSPAATLLIGIGAMAASTWRLVTLSREEAAARSEEEAEAVPASRPGLEGGRGGGAQRWDEESEAWVDDDSGDESR